MAGSSSEGLKVEENNGGGDTDRITSLPDSVLLHILSFLPTKTCVATMSLVSRRWRHLWEHLQVFDFSGDSHRRDFKSFKSFAFFVSSVLAIRRSREIRKMHLDSSISFQDTFTTDSVGTWLRAAAGPRLEELSLTISDCYEREFRIRCHLAMGMVLPPIILFNCINLVSLSLCGVIHVNVSSAVLHFPSLKMLKLDVDFVDSVDALLSACPILETLNIVDLPEDIISEVRVPLSLKRLELNGILSDTVLEIYAYGLRYLSITTGCGIFKYAVGNLQNVVEAHINVFSLYESLVVNNPILNLLQALSGVKHLVLCHSTTKWLVDFPEFRYLLHLKLILPYFNMNLLVSVLQKCHMLKVLKIKTDKEVSPLQTWDPQSTRVPNCLISTLTFVHLEGYQGFEDELEFAEYILRNGLVLKTMVIIADLSLDLEKKHCILKRLSDIPRGSVMCQLKFD